MADEGVADRAMERYADGDAEAFATVYDALAPQLTAFLRRHARGHAEDIVQQTFFQMHLARGSFIRGAPVKPWAYAIARRLLIDRQRRERRAAEAREELPLALVPVSADGPDQLLFAREAARGLEVAFAGIPESQREAFQLVRGGMSTRDAASLLGTTVAAVKLRASRALRALRRLATPRSVTR